MTLPAAIWLVASLGQCDAQQLLLRAGALTVVPGEERLSVPIVLEGARVPFPDFFALALEWDPEVLELVEVRVPEDVEQRPFNTWDQQPESGLARVLHLGFWQQAASYIPVNDRATLVWLEMRVLRRWNTLVRVNPTTLQDGGPWWHTQVHYCGRLWTFGGPDGLRLFDSEVLFDDGSFLRGDVDGNGRLDLTDAIRTLTFLFEGKGGPACEDAADCDDDGLVTITDAVYLGRHLFLAGSPPPPPFPDRGPDPTGDATPCHAGDT